MKFSCDKKALQEAVFVAARAASSKSPLTALEGILISAAYNLRLTGYDLKKGIYTDIEADIPEQGSIVLNARLFGEIVRSLPEGTVTIESDEKLKTRICCGQADFSIIGSSADEFPELPFHGGEGEQLSLPQGTVKTMINETSFAASDNEARPIYTGLLFEVKDGTLIVVAVDGYRMAVRRERVADCGVEEASFIVPASALSDLEKICSDSEDKLTINLGRKHVLFRVGSTALVSRLLEGEFMDYEKAIPSEHNVRLKVESADLKRTIERVSLVIDDKIKTPVRCNFGVDSVSMTCMTPLGKAEDVCHYIGDGKSTEIGFNNRYLLDAIKAAPATGLLMCLNGTTAPCVFRPLDGGDEFAYMILPVRLKN